MAWHFISNHDRNAISWVSGGKGQDPCLNIEILATTKLDTQAACSGLAICPTPESDNLTLRPKSRAQSIPLRASASLGCKCRRHDGISWDGHDCTRSPKRPFSWSLFSERAKPRHPHGHGRNCDPHACNAVGATPSEESKNPGYLPSSAPNAILSASSRERAISSLGSHREMYGIRHFTAGKLSIGIQGFKFTPPKDGCVSNHQVRDLRHGQISCKWRSICSFLKPVSEVNLSMHCATNLSLPAGVTHSNITILHWR